MAIEIRNDEGVVDQLVLDGEESYCTVHEVLQGSIRPIEPFL